MPNPIYTYIKYILFVNKELVGKMFKQTRAYLFAHSSIISSISI